MTRRNQYRESRKHLRDRLQVEGRWLQFIKVREDLKAQGMPQGEAWVQASLRFPPLEAGEVPSPPIDDPGDDPASPPSPSAMPPASPGPAKEAEVRLDAFLEQFTNPNERANSRESVEWVSKFLRVKDAGPDMAPSSQAWNLLQWVRSDSRNEDDFWKSIWKPGRIAEADANTRPMDDGREIIGIIDKILLIQYRSCSRILTRAETERLLQTGEYYARPRSDKMETTGWEEYQLIGRYPVERSGGLVRIGGEPAEVIKDHLPGEIQEAIVIRETPRMMKDRLTIM